MKKLLLTCLLALLTPALAQEPPAGPPMPSEEEMMMMAETAKRWGLPEGTIKVSECVPGMGEHWANPADLPFGPIYGMLDGELLFVEIMVAQNDFAEGKSWTEQLMSPKWFKKIHHVDIEFVPHGHEGYMVPHYDIHAYFMPHEEHLAFCPPPAP